MPKPYKKNELVVLYNLKELKEVNAWLELSGRLPVWIGTDCKFPIAVNLSSSTWTNDLNLPAYSYFNFEELDLPK